MNNKKSTNIRANARSAALDLLAPNLLESAEEVGQAAHDWNEAKKRVDAAGDRYRHAWENARDNGWKQEQLDQLVAGQRPPKRTTSSSTRSAESTTPPREQTEATTTTNTTDPQT